MRPDMLDRFVRPWLSGVLLSDGALRDDERRTGLGLEAFDPATVPSAVEYSQVTRMRIGMTEVLSVQVTDRARVATVGCSRVDTGLTTVLDSGDSARVAVEIVAEVSARHAYDAARAVAAVAAWMASLHGSVTPRPGAVLPDLFRGISPWEHAVAHAALIEPQMWGQGTPRLLIDEGADAGVGSAAESAVDAPVDPPLTLVLPLQLLALTPSEFAWALEHSVRDVAGHLSSSGVDAGDWDRPA